MRNRILIAAMVAAATLASCGGGTADTADTADTAETSAPAAAVETTTPATASAPPTTVEPSATTAEDPGDGGEGGEEDASGDPASERPLPRPDGPAAPDFELALGDGGTFRLSDEERPVYMVFWAEW